MHSAWPGRCSIPCGPGQSIAHRCHYRKDLSASNGGRVLATANNSARDRILEKIRAGLRVKVDSPPPANISYEQIFEPVTDPMQRFLAEAKANLMECIVTSD